MGQYSEHWKNYRRDSARGTFYLLALIALGLPSTAALAFAVQRFTGNYPAYVHIGLLLLWLVTFAAVAVRYSRVVCPKCATIYSRGKGLCNCPRCGLRMLQEEP